MKCCKLVFATSMVVILSFSPSGPAHAFGSFRAQGSSVESAVELAAKKAKKSKRKTKIIRCDAGCDEAKRVCVQSRRRNCEEKANACLDKCQREYEGNE